MLSRPFIALALTMFAATMGIGMVTPVLPVYAVSLGATGVLVGLTFSAFAVAQVIISPFAGRLADRFGRRPFLLFGLLVYVLTAAGWWLTDSLTAAIGFRVLSGVGSALIFSLSQAYVGDLAPRGQEGRYMGTFGIFEFVGFGVGPLLAGAIRDQTDLQTVFLCMAVLFACAFAVVALLLPSYVPGASGGRPRQPSDVAPALVPWGEVLRDPATQALWVVRVAFACAMGASMSFIAVHLEESLLVSATLVGAVLAGQQVSGGMAQPLMGLIADRVPRRTMAMTGSVMIGLGYASATVSESYLVIFVAFVIGVGIGGAMTNASTQAVQVAVGRRLGMATVAGMQSMAFATGMVIGSLGGGVLAEWFGVSAVFASGGAMMVLGGLFFVIRTRGMDVDAAAPVAAADTPVVDPATAPESSPPSR